MVSVNDYRDFAARAAALPENCAKTAEKLLSSPNYQPSGKVSFCLGQIVDSLVDPC
jgi:hypothetical protein